MEDKQNEANYFFFDFWNGILIGFAIHHYPEQDRKDLCFYLPFMRFGWVKQMMNDDDAEQFLNQ